ncbi:hypothetical protein FACS189444_6470 [Spirochaetia bacterium]|nr:hypothetical protein FACS189444_6470 [Spirochaetia bacterium]
MTTLLSGMNDPRQLEENLSLADSSRPGSLTEAEQGTYQKVLEIFNRSYKIHCTGCNYCMPCPRGVNIPGCFAAYNTSFSMGFVQGMQQFATSITPTSEKTGTPAHCIKCGKCEQHCPQHLPIIKNLELVHTRMEPPLYRFAIAVARAFLGKNKAQKQETV